VTKAVSSGNSGSTLHLASCDAGTAKAASALGTSVATRGNEVVSADQTACQWISTDAVGSGVTPTKDSAATVERYPASAKDLASLLQQQNTIFQPGSGSTKPALAPKFGTGAFEYCTGGSGSAGNFTVTCTLDAPDERSHVASFAVVASDLLDDSTPAPSASQIMSEVETLATSLTK
jgi:hypothetical protein